MRCVIASVCSCAHLPTRAHDAHSSRSVGNAETEHAKREGASLVAFGVFEDSAEVQARLDGVSAGPLVVSCHPSCEPRYIKVLLKHVFEKALPSVVVVGLAEEQVCLLDEQFSAWKQEYDDGVGNHQAKFPDPNLHVRVRCVLMKL